MSRARLLRPLPILGLSLVAALVSGCGFGTANTVSAGSLQIRGSIYGGQQPVVGASIRLYSAGKAGNGSPATPMLVTPVTSGANGIFSITGDYTCANSADQVYIVATGGNPGLAAGTNNAALAMMTALGNCGNLSTTPFITINEVTTVAAAWALGPFMTSATNLGASATNSAGLASAFANAALLADPQLGKVPTLAAGRTVESAKVYALANSLASCINSDGTTGCGPLFSAATPAGGTAPTNTINAALNVVKNPASKVAAVYNAAGSFPPFPSTLPQAPHDWTMTLTLSGGGMSEPSTVSLDRGGNAWVASYNGVLSEFNPQGVAVSPTGYGIGTLSETYAAVIDSNNDVWATILENPRHNPTRGSVAKFAGASSANPGALIGTYTDASINYPLYLSADNNGNVVVDNYAITASTTFNTSGTVVNSYFGQGNSAFPVAVAYDSTHGFWLANQADTTVTHVAANGAILARPSCCNVANGVATDALGNAWFSSYYSSSVSEVTAAGTVAINQATGGGLNYPAGVVVDAAQDVFLANYHGTSLTKVAGNLNASPAGTMLSPAGGFGLDVTMVLPDGVAVDPAGSVWVTNFGNDTMTVFLGLATPTKTPVTPIPVAP